jgi:hypothetical protein
MKIYILESEDWVKSKISRDDVLDLVNKYSVECANILKEISPNLNIIVKPNLPHISGHKGLGGSTYDHELIDVTFDVSLPYGLKKFQRYLRETIFHEMNHAMHTKFYPREERQLYWAVLEGLGIVFDREYAKGVHFANGRADKTEMLAWLKQQLTTSTRSPDAPDDWTEMIYDVGTWIVDLAIKNTGKDVVELTKLSCDEILKLADINPQIS